MKNPLANLMQQAQNMQENLKKAQEELAATQIAAESGGGLIKLTLNGKREILSLRIDDSLLTDDKEVLEDLIIAALNDGMRKVSKLKEEKLSGLAGGFELPAGLKLPF
ncbi:YbaB/EbfC family nucleoid-associated protein [Candidatus Methylospira mobilis]|uniref:YbaB/EbfC family nucleoid-associated protein n=1 Tax=Candidatus Methylospira mobilis TaxID=1808979 RepID=UPI0028E60569|nr:YbaB/EbfC family nucleoid-associated protein [Candidatus Methylospira mobilis]WNV04587.1 YbaB/EbfC family nucleoid-associated protein [Candidatus Methylospira mobilis]